MQNRYSSNYGLIQQLLNQFEMDMTKLIRIDLDCSTCKELEEVYVLVDENDPYGESEIEWACKLDKEESYRRTTDKTNWKYYKCNDFKPTKSKEEKQAELNIGSGI